MCAGMQGVGLAVFADCGQRRGVSQGPLKHGPYVPSRREIVAFGDIHVNIAAVQRDHRRNLEAARRQNQGWPGGYRPMAMNDLDAQAPPLNDGVAVLSDKVSGHDDQAIEPREFGYLALRNASVAQAFREFKWESNHLDAIKRLALRHTWTPGCDHKYPMTLTHEVTIDIVDVDSLCIVGEGGIPVGWAENAQRLSHETLWHSCEVGLANG